ncbi:hypothetical protein DFP72DRAFT_1082472 [Ephemerocybe angulata]|uniref:Uncharacterized protein n=1 Tax=Ephemerocybe angulata TaxID=980116 RepID=A0A8H6H7V9_9AGAR|nr:hypothetical protein DFP72DRAFT_1082472 [Tulosesus angulatus]
MNTTDTSQSQSQASTPGQKSRERVPTPAELIARLKQQNQTLSLATLMGDENDSDLFRRAWRHIPSFKSLNEGPQVDLMDEEKKALLNEVKRVLQGPSASGLSKMVSLENFMGSLNKAEIGYLASLK